MLKKTSQLFIIFLLVNSQNSTAASLSLKEALILSSKNNIQNKILDQSDRIIKAKASAIDTSYDWKINSSITQIQDESPSQNTALGEKREITKGNFSSQKLFSTGTLLKLSYTQNKSKITYPKVLSTTSLLQSQSTSQINPEYSDQLELSIVQNLWKNFNGREIELKRQVILSNSSSLSNIKKAQSQQVQGQTEQLYWKLIGAKNKIYSLRQLLKASNKFLKLTKDREKIGRSDQVDVAAAEAVIVNHEGLILKLEISKEIIENQIYRLIYPRGIKKIIQFSGASLSKSPLALPANSVEELISLAKKQSFNLKQLEQEKTPSYIKYLAAKESNKFSFDAFANLSGNGMADSQSDSFKSASKQENPTITLGFQFSTELGGSFIRSASNEYSNERIKIDLQKQALENQIRMNIELIWIEKTASKKLQNQARAHIRSLKRQQKVEQRRFRQARTGKIAVVKYDMEIISAETELISAQEDQRVAEAKLRLLTNSYPEVL